MPSSYHLAVKAASGTALYVYVGRLLLGCSTTTLRRPLEAPGPACSEPPCHKDTLPSPTALNSSSSTASYRAALALRK